MTEQEWLECTDPRKMLRLPILDNIGERKLRMFACACCRRMWNLLTDERIRAVIEITEKYADRIATQQNLDAAREEAQHAATSPVITLHTATGTVDVSPGSVVSYAASTGTHFSPRGTAFFAAMFAEEVTDKRTAFDAERKEQASVFRDLIGNPFRPVAINPAWLAWHDGTVRRIARSIYDERAFDRMPILADALTDAECDNADILNHCRSVGQHVRGCWVIDLLLGKE